MYKAHSKRPGLADALIQRTLDHALLGEEETLTLIRTAQLGYRQRRTLFIRQIKFVSDIIDRFPRLGAAAATTFAVRIMDETVARYDVLGKKKFRAQAQLRVPARIGDDPTSSLRMNVIDVLIAEAAPLASLPELFDHYPSLKKNLDAIGVALQEAGDEKVPEQCERVLRKELISVLWHDHAVDEKVIALVQKALRSFKPTTPREEQQAVKDMRAGLLAEDRIVRHNGRLIIKIAHKFKRSMSLRDCVVAGQDGVVQAIHRFDFDRGVTFSKYAGYWIRQSIGRMGSEEIRTIKLPIHAEQRATRILRMHVPGIKTMTDAELSKVSDCKLEHVRGLRPHLAQILYLSMPVMTHNKGGVVPEVTLGETIPTGTETPEEAAQTSQRAALVRKLLKSITNPRERDIILSRFGFNGKEETLPKIGMRYGLTRERIRQLEAGVLERFREQVRQLELTDETI